MTCLRVSSTCFTLKIDLWFLRWASRRPFCSLHCFLRISDGRVVECVESKQVLRRMDYWQSQKLSKNWNHFRSGNHRLPISPLLRSGWYFVHGAGNCKFRKGIFRRKWENSNYRWKTPKIFFQYGLLDGIAILTKSPLVGVEGRSLLQVFCLPLIFGNALRSQPDMLRRLLKTRQIF